MATTEFIAAIEIGSSKASGIAGRKNSDGSIQVLAYAHEDADTFARKGVVYNIEKAATTLGNIVGKLEAQLGSSIAKVYTSIGGQSLRTVSNSVSRSFEEETRITDELIDEIYYSNREMETSGAEILDVEPQEYLIHNQLYVDPVGMSSQSVTGNFLNIVARSQVRRNLERSFEQAQLEVADRLIAPCALAKAVLADNELRSGCALVDFGADTTTIAIYKNNLLRNLCVLPLGGNDITRDIATLQMEEEDAEKLKLQYGDALYEEEESDTPATCTMNDGRIIELSVLNDIVGARAEEILANVWNLIKQSGYADKLFCGIVLTGGASNLKHLVEAFKKQSNTEKVRVATWVQGTVHGCNQIAKDGSNNTLLGLLINGEENCCKPQVATHGVNDIFANDEILKEQEKTARAAKEEREKKKRQEEEERKRRQEEERKKRKDKKSGLINIFSTLAEKVLGEGEDEKFNS